MHYDLGRLEIRKRNRLPHWDAEHAIYFVTFNLCDAIPRHVLDRIRAEADAQLTHIRTLRGSCTIAEKNACEEWVRAKCGDALDETYGACFMRDTRIATIVANAITHFDEERYELLAWCVMPNHAHVVMSLINDTLDRVLHSWKSFTAKRCNALLERTGKFWQDDYYDRCIRDSKELSTTIDYVVNNPAKADLRDWPFVRVYGDRLA